MPDPIDLIPTDAIAADALARDRAATDPAALAELRDFDPRPRPAHADRGLRPRRPPRRPPATA